MNKVEKNERNESGFILILFMVLLPVILALLGLVVDSANLYSASLKASAAAEAGVTSAVLARIKEPDTRILNWINTTNSANNLPSKNYERSYLIGRSYVEIENNLVNNAVKKRNAGDGNGDRSVEIHSINTEFDPVNDVLRADVKLKVPTLFMHYFKKDLLNKTSSQIVTGTASIRLEGANYIFVLDLSNSQNCPAGIKYAGKYCRCNSADKAMIRINGKLEEETCQQEADGVTDTTLRGFLRVEKTRDSLKNALNRLDPKRDRLSIIGFNSVAFTILPFKPIDPLTTKAAQGFDMVKTRAILDQLKSQTKAKNEFRLGGDGKIAKVEGVPVIVPEGMTNLSDGFLTAYQEAKAAGLANKSTGVPYNVIYYSDGGSTGMRANFPNLVNKRSDPVPFRNPFFIKTEKTPRTFNQATLLEDNPRAVDSLDYYPSLTTPSEGGWENDMINLHQALRLGSQRYDSAGPIMSAGGLKRWYLRNLMNIKDKAKLGASLPLKPKIPTSQIDTFYPRRKDANGNFIESASDRNQRYLSVVTDDYISYSLKLLPNCYCLPVGSGNCNNPNAKINDAISDTDVYKRENLLNQCLGNRDFIGRFSKNDTSEEGKKNQFGEGFKPEKFVTKPSNNYVHKFFPPPRGEVTRDFRYLYYMSAMEASDMLRKNNGKVHGIGYGQSTKDLSGMAQGLADVSGLKAGVMANLASAFDDLLSIYNVKDLALIDNKFKTNNKGYETLKERQDSGSSGGAFYQAPTAAEFEAFLNLLIIKIKMSVQTVS